MQISKSYSMNDWHEDIKRVMRYAGEDNRPTVFLFSDSQIKSEAFLVDINNLLNAGEVGGHDDVAAYKKYWFAKGCIDELIAWWQESMAAESMCCTLE
jgi:hypothetical protein